MKAILCAALFASAAGATLAQSHSSSKPVTVDIKNAQGQSVGTAHASTVAPNVTLGEDASSIFSNGGTSIVIHAVAGGTGTAAPARIGCGVIAKPQ